MVVCLNQFKMLSEEEKLSCMINALHENNEQLALDIANDFAASIYINVNTHPEIEKLSTKEYIYFLKERVEEYLSPTLL